MSKRHQEHKDKRRSKLRIQHACLTPTFAKCHTYPSTLETQVLFMISIQDDVCVNDMHGHESRGRNAERSFSHGRRYSITSSDFKYLSN